MNSLVESIGKSEFRIMYNNTLCEFIPSPNCSLDEIPDTVKGKVVYVLTRLKKHHMTIILK